MDTCSSVKPAEFSPAVLIDKSQDGSLGHLEFFFRLLVGLAKSTNLKKKMDCGLSDTPSLNFRVLLPFLQNSPDKSSTHIELSIVFFENVKILNSQRILM